MEMSSRGSRPKVQRSASAAGKDATVSSSRRGFQTFKILSNNYNLEATTTTDEGNASSGDNICEETTTLLPAPRSSRSNPRTPPLFDPSLQTPPMDPSSSLSMTHPTGWGIQFSHSRSTPASSPSMTSRYTHPEEWQFGRSTPQSIKEGTEMSSNCGSYCPEYSTATFGNNFSNRRGIYCEDVTCDHESCSCPENTCATPPLENRQLHPSASNTPSPFATPLLVNGRIHMREQMSPRTMISSMSGKIELTDPPTSHLLSHQLHGKYKNQGVSANFVSCLSEGTCVDCGGFEDGRYPPECPNARQGMGMSFLDFYQIYGSKDSLATSKKSFNCESLMILTIISTLTCLATLLMGALSYLFLMKNY